MNAVQIRARSLLPFALGLWVVGVQVNEVFGTIGAWSTVVFASLAPRALAHWRREEMLFGFLLVSVALPLSVGITPTGTGVARLADWLLIPGAALAVAQLSPKEMYRVALCGACALMLSATVAGLQYFGLWPKAEAFEHLRWTGFNFQRVYETVPGRDDRFMGGGLLFHRLKFANVTAALGVMAAAAAVPPTLYRRLAGIVAAIAISSVAIFPHARAASVALAIAVSVTWLVGTTNVKRAALGVLALVLALGAIIAVTPSLRTRFAEGLEGQSASERVALNQAGLKALVSRPMTGIGVGRFRPGLFAADDAPDSVKQHPGKAHNQFLTVAAEAGVPSFLVLLVVLLRWLKEGVAALPRSAVLVGGITLFIALSLLHDPLFHAESSMALMLLLGTGLGLARSNSVS